MISKTLTANAVRTAKGFTATISTETIDRDGEVLSASGMVSKEYERNPVVLWMHDHAMPIGKVVSLRRMPNAIAADVQFAPRPEDYQGDWFPDYIAGLVGAGVLNAVSVGFMEMDGGTRMATKDDAKKYGDGVRRVFSRWQLLELSVVSVPANSDALISAVHKGLLSPTLAKRFGGVTVEAKPKPEPIRVRVPEVGTVDIAKAVGDEVRVQMAKLRGKLFA